MKQIFYNVFIFYRRNNELKKTRIANNSRFIVVDSGSIPILNNKLKLFVKCIVFSSIEHYFRSTIFSVLFFAHMRTDDNFIYVLNVHDYKYHVCYL